MSPEIKRGPVNPAEAAELQTELIPDEVFVAFNGLIARRLHSGRATVRQNEVIAALEAQGLERHEIFDKNWLDVEDSYRANGWQVKYNRPIYYAGEDFEPYFEFHAEDK